MKMMRKSRLTQAVAAAVFAAGLSATMVAPTTVEAAPTNNPHGIGDTLLFPYYTTENGFITLVHLVNNDPDRTVMAKIRMREFKNSVDVLDFNIILSPNDVFAGYLRSSADDVLEFVKTDNTCTSPHATGSDGNGAGGVLTFGSNTGLATTHTGHIEVITMGVIDNDVADDLATTNRAYIVSQGALHDAAGVPANCSNVDASFTTANIEDLQDDVTDVVAGTDSDDIEGNENASVNALSGHYVLLNTSQGISGGGRPLVLQDTTTVNTSDVSPASQADGDNPADPLVNPCGGSELNLLCAQASSQFFAPSMANLNGITTACDSSNGGLTCDYNVARFVDIETAINGSLGQSVAGLGGRTLPRLNDSFQNEWTGRTFNTSGRTSSEIVVTLPLKHIYNDTTDVATNGNDTVDIFAGSSITDATTTNWDAVDTAIRGDDELFRDGTSLTDTDGGCVRYARSLINREESRTTASTEVSGPTTATDLQFCNETQVFTFNDGVTNPGDDASSGITIGSNNFGWFDVVLLDEDGDTLSQAVANTGMSFWQRNFGSADRNYGQIIGNTRRNSQD